MAWIKENITGSSLLNIDLSLLRLDASIGTISKVESYEQVASYNWRGDAHQPIIVVPGQPATMLAAAGEKLEKDTGSMVTNYGHYMLPKYSSDPTIWALIVCEKLLEL